MGLLSDQQKERAIEIMQEHLAAPADPTLGTTPMEQGLELDGKRVKLIDETLLPLLRGYFNFDVPFQEFKINIDGINKRNEFWGFKGIKGQMFFNMAANVADDPAEFDSELKAVLVVPADETIAASRLKTFASYVKRLGEQWVEAGNSKHGRPKPGSIPFFVSYFWQIQDRSTWPVYYTNSVNTMNDLNLWQPSGDLTEDYLKFKQIQEELAVVFSQASGKKFDLYEVEHVFWFKGQNPYQAKKVKPMPSSKSSFDRTEHPEAVTLEPSAERLPESYVPPIISVLPGMARHDKGLTEAAKRSGTSIARAFEKSVNVAFTMIGYETKLLGHGKGRVPDGSAISIDDSYAILWDGKVRADGYSIGTDDRTIREYITTQSKEMKRRRSLRNIYYLIVSSTFAEDYEDTIRSIKMETDVSEVILLEADALVSMVDAKLRDPLGISLGSDGLQRLFSVSGKVTAEVVREQLVGH